MKRPLTAILTLCVAALIATAQVTVSGIVADPQGTAIQFANVVLVNAADSSYVQGTVTDQDGSFSLGDAPATGLLRVSMLGYETLYHPYTSPQVGRLVMQPDAQTLGEVTVTGHRAAYKLTPTGLQTNVQGTVLSQLGNGDDVLAMIPGLVVNSDGDYEVFGKGKPEFYLNGRKVYDMKQITALTSQQIKDVEVIRNPGAKYDATVKAVVRITTVKQQGDGWGFNVWGEYRHSEQQKYLVLPRLNWNYRTGGWDIFGSHSFSGGETRQHNDMDQEISAGTLWHQKMESWEKDSRKNLHNTLGTNYSFDDNNSVGVKYTISTVPSEKMHFDMQATVLADGEYYDDLTSSTYERNKHDPSHYLNAYYNGKAGKLGIDVNVDWNHSSSTSESTSDEASTNSQSRTFSTLGASSNNLWAGKAILTYPVWLGELSAGLEVTNTRFNTSYYADVDFLESSDTQLKERHFAPFVDYQFACKQGMFSAGLRYEHVAFDYYDAGIKQHEQSRRFDNVFPTFSWGQQLGQTMLQLGYTTRIKRPDYRSLSSRVDYVNRYLIQQGNPKLNSEIFHSFNAALVWRWLQVAASYDDTRDYVTQVAQEIEGTDGALLLTWLNLPSCKQASLTVSAAPQIGKWSPQFLAYVQRTWLSTGQYQMPYKFNRPLFNFSITNTYELNKDFLLRMNAGVVTKGDEANVRVLKAKGSVDFGIIKYFLNRSLTVRAMVYDIFNTNHTHAMTAQGNATLRVRNITGTRSFNVSVQYRFNTTRSKYKGTGAGNDEKDRF